MCPLTDASSTCVVAQSTATANPLLPVSSASPSDSYSFGSSIGPTGHDFQLVVPDVVLAELEQILRDFAGPTERLAARNLLSRAFRLSTTRTDAGACVDQNGNDSYEAEFGRRCHRPAIANGAGLPAKADAVGKERQLTREKIDVSFLQMCPPLPSIGSEDPSTPFRPLVPPPWQSVKTTKNIRPRHIRIFGTAWSQGFLVITSDQHFVNACVQQGLAQAGSWTLLIPPRSLTGL
eukprot:GHVT01085410.1.p2 GENE.GHVT01085410.1~~GHVT01085410.1.p2  ORF type:complete len:235 (+),score=17.74 GHVT01085410.1:2474-3178(+)